MQAFHEFHASGSTTVLDSSIIQVDVGMLIVTKHLGVARASTLE